MKEYRLLELKVEVNRSCPLNCLHCSSNACPKAPERLDLRKIKELLSEFVYLGGERLCISGGEPLYYEELADLIDSCRGTNLKVSLYTTGITPNGGSLKPMSERVATFLADRYVKVVFSLHGACAKTHDTLTQVQGSFDSTITAIERAIEAGISAEVHVVPTVLNFRELTDIIKLIDSYNIKKVSWLRFVPQGRGFFNRHLLQLSSKQLGELGQKKLQLQEDHPNLVIRTGAPFNVLCAQVPARCEAGLSVLTINPDGSVSPCDAFKRFRIDDDFGNILNHSLSEVWLKSRFLNAVRSIHESRLNSDCISCTLYSRCNSGCLAQKAIASGMINNGRDPDCRLDGLGVVRDEIKAITVC